MQSGMSAKDAEGALVGLGYSAREAAGTMEALGAAASKSVVPGLASASASMVGFERASAMAAARITGSMVPGLGMAGYQLGRVAAFLPGMGPLFQAALPIALIAFAAERIKDWNDELDKTRDKITALAVSTREEADAIEIENLKLEDQISKLENRPTVNGPAIALEEIRLKADKVAESIGKALQSVDELLKSAPGTFSALLSGGPNEEAVGKQLAVIERQYQLDVLARDATAQHNDLLEAQRTLQEAITKVMVDQGRARMPPRSSAAVSGKAKSTRTMRP